ncbi:MAG: 3-methyl-2-oxobutanoate hydroxymethyltransferase [Betaproteobacteria bacterium]|nr:3-methyl-2-oxobutanoate hydroxymethyltransferase [Betaproteobacteria bacterium]
MSVHTSPQGAAAPVKPVTLPQLKDMHARGDKIAMLTAYDASFASLLDQCGVDCLLVGDSLGMVMQGHDSTLPVTHEQVVYHVQCVARGIRNATRRAWLIGDMPFGTFSESPEHTYRHACDLMKAGAQMVKIEGGAWLLPTIEFLTQRGVPVCAHLGLTPQFIHQLGGYRIQARTQEARELLLRDAKALESAGASMLVLELVPTPSAQYVTENLHIATIGIGAGPHCSGQVLVLQDMLDIYPGKKARFVKNFLAGHDSVADAVRDYVAQVRAGSFPAAEHSYEQ